MWLLMDSLINILIECLNLSYKIFKEISGKEILKNIYSIDIFEN